MPNENLANLSDLLMYSAMLVYALAFLAFATDLGNLGSRRLRRRETAPALVKAGSGGPDVVVDLRDGAQDVQLSDSAEPSSSAIEPEPARRAAGAGTSLTLLALGLHVGAVVTRGLAASRAPWGNMYEFTLTGTCVLTAVYAVAVARNRDYRTFGAFVVGPVLLALGASALLFYTVASRLVPALQSGFLWIHVSVAFVSTALFTLAFSAHILQLLQGNRSKALAAGKTPRGGRFMERLPSWSDLENLGFRLVAISFPLWTFTLVAGAIWAQKAWNKYWGWDPKEVWTFVVWVVYAAYLHARATRGWTGRRATMIALAGFVCVILNFTVVNMYFAGRHSYAGVG